MNKFDQSINSENFGFSVIIRSADQPRIYSKRDESRGRPLREDRAADNQREKYDSKSREIFIPAVQGLRPGISASDPEFPLHLSLLGLLLRGGSGERISISIILEDCIPPGNHARNQRERDESYEKIVPEEKDHATKNLRDY